MFFLRSMLLIFSLLLLSCTLFETDVEPNIEPQYTGDELKIAQLKYHHYSTTGSPLTAQLFFEYDENWNLESIIRRNSAWDIIQKIDFIYEEDTIQEYHIFNVLSTISQNYEYDTIRVENGFWKSTLDFEKYAGKERSVLEKKGKILEKHTIQGKDTINRRIYSYDINGNLIHVKDDPWESSFNYSTKTINPFNPLSIISAFNYPSYFEYDEISSSTHIPGDISLPPFINNLEYSTDSLDRVNLLKRINTSTQLVYTTEISYIN